MKMNIFNGPLEIPVTTMRAFEPCAPVPPAPVEDHSILKGIADAIKFRPSKPEYQTLQKFQADFQRLADIVTASNTGNAKKEFLRQQHEATAAMLDGVAYEPESLESIKARFLARSLAARAAAQQLGIDMREFSGPIMQRFLTEADQYVAGNDYLPEFLRKVVPANRATEPMKVQLDLLRKRLAPGPGHWSLCAADFFKGVLDIKVI